MVSKLTGDLERRCEPRCQPRYERGAGAEGWGLVGGDEVGEVDWDDKRERVVKGDGAVRSLGGETDRGLTDGGIHQVTGRDGDMRMHDDEEVIDNVWNEIQSVPKSVDEHLRSSNPERPSAMRT